MWEKTKDAILVGLAERFIEYSENSTNVDNRIQLSKAIDSDEWNLNVYFSSYFLYNKLKIALGRQSFHVRNNQNDNRVFRFQSSDPRIISSALARIVDADGAFEPFADDIRARADFGLREATPYEEIPRWFSKRIRREDNTYFSQTWQNTRHEEIYDLRLFLKNLNMSVVINPKDTQTYTRLKQTIENDGYILCQSALRDEMGTLEFKSDDEERIKNFLCYLINIAPSLATMERTLIQTVNISFAIFLLSQRVDASSIEWEQYKASTLNTLRLSQAPPAQESEPEIPERFLCAISKLRMTDPLIVPGCSDRCDRASLQKWLDQSPNKTNPFTNEPGLNINTLQTDQELLAEIEEYFNPGASRKNWCVIS